MLQRSEAQNVSTSSDYDLRVAKGIESLESQNTFDLTPISNSGVVGVSSFQSPSFDPICIGQSPSLSYELACPLTVFGALYINGQILGLTCFSTVAARSPSTSMDVPLPLQPTPTQLLTIPLNGIDRFPFPKMRDNFINMSGVLDEEEFSYDLFTMPSFSIMPGAVSWNPKAWKIEKPFAEKWGFLFCSLDFT